MNPTIQKRAACLALALALCPALAGCTGKPPALTLSATPVPTATPAPTATPEPAETPQPQESFYLDYSGATAIARSYRVTYPKAQMPGWQESTAPRQNALLTLVNGARTIEVTMEELPDIASLEDFTQYCQMMLAFTYEGVAALIWEKDGEKMIGETLLPTGDVETRLTLVCFVQDGLYVCASLVSTGDEMETDRALLLDTFVPDLRLAFDPEGLAGIDDVPAPT